MIQKTNYSAKFELSSSKKEVWVKDDFVLGWLHQLDLIKKKTDLSISVHLIKLTLARAYIY